MYFGAVLSAFFPDSFFAFLNYTSAPECREANRCQITSRFLAAGRLEKAMQCHHRLFSRSRPALSEGRDAPRYRQGNLDMLCVR